MESHSHGVLSHIHCKMYYLKLLAFLPNLIWDFFGAFENRNTDLTAICDYLPHTSTADEVQTEIVCDGFKVDDFNRAGV